MAEKLGDAILELKTDSKKFDKGIKKAGKRTQKLESKLKRTAIAAKFLKSKLVAIGAVLLASAGITKAIFMVADLGDKMAKMSQKTGIAVETLSSLKLVAELGGASIDSFAKGIQKLSKNMFDISVGSGAEAKKAFEDLGIAAQNSDGSIRDSLDVVLEISDKFSKMENGARKTALAMSIFGRAGVELIPTLNQGSAAISDQIKLAKDLGLEWSEKTSKNAEAFNDALTKLKAGFFGLWKRIVNFFLPALTSVANGLTFLLRLANRFSNSFGGPVSSSMKEVTVTATDLGNKLKTISAERLKELEKATTRFATRFTDSMVDMVTSSDVTFSRILQGFLIMLAKMAARAAASNIVSGLFSAASSNPAGLASRAVGGLSSVGKVLGFAEGGVVPGPKGAPVPAVVHGGETITPPGEGGGAGVVQNINISPGLPETVRAEISQFMPAIRQAAVEAVEGARRRGGSMASAMGAKA
jgi:hypothetical protein